MAVGTTAAIIGGGLLAGAMTKQTLDARKARKEATARSDRAEFEAQQQIEALKTEEKHDKLRADSISEREAARKRQRKTQAGQGTFLTGGVGAPAATPSTTNKTLLGS